MGGTNPADATLATGSSFQTNNAKFILMITSNSGNIKQEIKTKNSWDKYKSEIIGQTKSDNSDYLIDPTFRNINRLLVLSFKNVDDNPTRNSFDEYYMPLIEFKDLNALIYNQTFFDKPVKNKQEAYKNLLKYLALMIMQKEIY